MFKCFRKSFLNMLRYRPLDASGLVVASVVGLEKRGPARELQVDLAVLALATVLLHLQDSCLQNMLLREALQRSRAHTSGVSTLLGKIH